jgi:hypothetical protein
MQKHVDAGETKVQLYLRREVKERGAGDEGASRQGLSTARCCSRLRGLARDQRATTGQSRLGPSAGAW